MSVSSLLLYVKLAMRNLWRNPRRSMLTATAIALGLSCLIIFGALKRGLHEEMRNSTVRLETGAVQVHAAGYEANVIHLKPLVNAQGVIEAAKRSGALSHSTRIKVPALVIAGDKSSSVMITGVEPELEQVVTIIASRVVEGSYLGNDGVLIGASLADSLGITVGQDIGLMAFDKEGSQRRKKFTVSGVFRTELSSFDRGHIYMPITVAQEFLKATGVVTEVVLTGDESAILNNLRGLLSNEDYVIWSWQEVAPDVKQIMDINDASLRLIALIVFAIVALGIANTMGMAIVERYREFGIIAALGTTPGSIMGLVLLESLLLGVIASFVGSALGLIACIYLSIHGIDLSLFTSSNQHMAISHILKGNLSALDFLSANVLTITTSVLASCLPALKVSRLRPVDAINHV